MAVKMLLIAPLVIATVMAADSRFPLTGGSSSMGSGSRDSFSSNSNSGSRDTFSPSGSRQSGSSSFGSSSSDNFGFSSGTRPSSASSDWGSDTFDTDNNDLFLAKPTRIQAWPNAIVPYEIRSDISDSNAAALKRMLADISQKTCVSFVPRRNEANYTLIGGGSGCSAPLGMSQKPQQIGSTSSRSSSGRSGASVVTLAPGCFTTKRVARRIYNLLGKSLPHETSRPDRDQFVEINMNNIRTGYADNLKQYTASSWLPGVLDLPYDMQSVTQYSDEDLAKDPKVWAIRPRNSRLSARDLGGENFSQGDYQKISAAYGCRSSSSSGSRGSGTSFGSSSGTRDSFGSSPTRDTSNFGSSGSGSRDTFSSGNTRISPGSSSRF